LRATSECGPARLVAAHVEIGELPAKQLLVEQRLLVDLAAERGFAEAQRRVELDVGGERLIEVDERDRRVVADRRMVPQLERLAIFGERGGVLRLGEERVAVLEDLERLGLRLGRDALGPRTRCRRSRRRRWHGRAFGFRVRDRRHQHERDRQRAHQLHPTESV
jgi:hypothetical protein